ncbi:MAG: aconitate hydratase [Myxococcales bacterium]|nr:aconitate hydratase [Myxococcales bacterium]
MSATISHSSFYQSFARRVAAARDRVGRPLTFAEKILFSHLAPMGRQDPAHAVPERKKSYAGLYPDRVAMQDATAQMALLQFMHAGRDTTAVPSTVHCDHLIRAHVGAKSDLLKAYDENDEVFAFLSTVSQRYGIGFWKPGAGIIHQVVLENYAMPGAMMIGTDSHTPNAGGLGMVAIGVGGADAVDVMVGEPFDLRWPGLIGVRLTGKLDGWTSPKDVILKLCSILTVKGGTGHIVEFFGPGTRALSCTGKGTITNMGAEHGATTSVFPYDDRMRVYLESTSRSDIATLCEAHAAELRADAEVEASPEKYFDRVIEIDLSTLEPHLVGPHTPDLARPVSEMAAELAREGYPEQVSYALIGSCTNSSYEDMERAAHVARQALDKGVKVLAPLMVSPGSDQIFATIERDGQLAALEAAGATVLSNACGPCIGQWQRDGVTAGTKNTIVTSFNRNFRGRNDSNGETLAFIGSPEIVIALALSGRLGFDPRRDSLTASDGSSFMLTPPVAPEVPARGFATGADGYIAPPEDGRALEVTIDVGSQRLQLLDRFTAWDQKDFSDLVVLLKASGKCTTDHISPAGAWLRFRGHLDKISDNMFIGAVNAFAEKPGTGVNVLTGEAGVSLPQIAREYKAKSQGWLAVGDENYGEGSSREHAAMSPRFLGARAVLVRSFARIAETNLKKQGVLPLTFAEPADYEKIRHDDRVAITGLAGTEGLAPGRPATVTLSHADGTTETFAANHSLSAVQIQWFKAGSTLNALALRESR